MVVIVTVTGMLIAKKDLFKEYEFVAMVCHRVYFLLFICKVGV